MPAKTHGLSRTSLYRRWISMKERCLNPMSRAWKHYGGRGIKVCARWMVFENYVKDVGSPKPGMQLDRSDNDGNYEPSNCRWVTAQINAQNRRNASMVELNGRKQNACEWSRELKISEQVISERIKRLGKKNSKAVLKPIMNSGHAANKRLVETLKRSINPKTGKGFSYREIGALLGMSGQAAYFYAGKIQGRCPECLRKLHRMKKK